MQGDELFREVHEELQREKLLGLWTRYGSLVLVLAGALLIGTAAWVLWQNWQARQRADAAIAYAAAETQLASRNFEAAADAYAALADDSTKGFRSLARLRQAQADVEAGKPSQALAALEALAKTSDADPILRDLAALQGVMLQIDAAPVDELRARLQPLAEAGKPFRAEAMEMQALLAVRAGDREQAKKILDDIAEIAEAPTNLRQRAQEMRKALDDPMVEGS